LNEDAAARELSSFCEDADFGFYTIPDRLFTASGAPRKDLQFLELDFTGAAFTAIQPVMKYEIAGFHR
jgi:hypothetical protein